MIKVTIIAEDYYVAEALNYVAAQIECEDLLDNIYDNKTDKMTLKDSLLGGGAYSVEFSRVDKEQNDNTTKKQDMIEECKLYAGMEYEINDLWNGDGYDTEKGIVTEIGIERFTNNRILHQFETYDEIDDEVLENILLAVKENPIVVKMAHTFLEDDETDNGGISFIGETLLDFMLSIPMPLTSSNDEINKALKECGIMPI